jgi:phospholipase C
LRNEGTAGAVFHIYDRTHPERIPRRYTVEAGRSLTDRWPIAGPYDLWVLGPSGFVRGFAGNADAPEIDVALAYRASQRAIELQLANGNAKPVSLSLESAVYGPVATRRIELSAHGTKSLQWDVSASGNWYDLTLLAGRGFLRRFAGRLETGKNGISDPAMGIA